MRRFFALLLLAGRYWPNATAASRDGSSLASSWRKCTTVSARAADSSQLVTNGSTASLVSGLGSGFALGAVLASFALAGLALPFLALGSVLASTCALAGSCAPGLGLRGKIG